MVVVKYREAVGLGSLIFGFSCASHSLLFLLEDINWLEFLS